MAQPFSIPEEWSASVPAALRTDPLWRVEAYRLATYVCDASWAHVSALARDKRTRALSDQLYRSLGSIGANLAEGYSRGGGRDRVRFYEYALGSAREARDWYFKARHVLDAEQVERQIGILASVTRLLLVMCKEQRSVHLREKAASYDLETRSDRPLSETTQPQP